MKKTLATIAALLMTAAAYGQGTVNFANRLPNVFDAAITVGTTTEGAGTLAGTTVQLLIQNGTSFTAVGSPIAFRASSGAAAKYFDGGAIEIPGTAAGGTATLAVRIAGLNVVGKDSPTWSQALGGGLLPAENMVNMKPFTVQAIPEPTTIAFGLLGAAALFAARRKS